jgi:Rrf2 family protein
VTEPLKGAPGTVWRLLEGRLTMQFTKAEEYGIMGVLYLAEKSEPQVTPLSEISEARQIPEKFLAKIFQSLARSGIVRSHRGVRGGFTLARDPSEIAIKEILESIQGPYHLLKSDGDGHHGEGAPFNALRELVMMAERRLLSVFEERTVADLVRWEKTESVC